MLCLALGAPAVKSLACIPLDEPGHSRDAHCQKGGIQQMVKYSRFWCFQVLEGRNSIFEYSNTIFLILLQEVSLSHVWLLGWHSTYSRAPIAIRHALLLARLLSLAGHTRSHSSAEQRFQKSGLTQCQTQSTPTPLLTSPPAHPSGRTAPQNRRLF